MNIYFNSLLQNLSQKDIISTNNNSNTIKKNINNKDTGILGNNNSSITASEIWETHNPQTNISFNQADNQNKEATMKNLNSLYDNSSKLYEEIRDNMRQQDDIMRQIDSLTNDGVSAGDNSSQLKELKKQLNELKNKYDSMYQERIDLLCEMNEMVDQIAENEGVEREIVLNRFPACNVGGPQDGEAIEKQSNGTYTIKPHTNIQGEEEVYYGSVYSNKYPVEDE